MMHKYSNALKRVQALEEQLAEASNSEEHDQSTRDRERELMMHFMLANIHIQRQERSAEEEEQRMLMRAIEESKRDSGPNPDDMTYEQLLQLEEENGKVSKGLKPF
jgi:cytochrome P450